MFSLHLFIFIVFSKVAGSGKERGVGTDGEGRWKQREEKEERKSVYIIYSL